MENSAGLSSVVTSPPYRHVVQLPTKGVVFDVTHYYGDFSNVHVEVIFNPSTLDHRASSVGLNVVVGILEMFCCATSPAGT